MVAMVVVFFAVGRPRSVGGEKGFRQGVVVRGRFLLAAPAKTKVNGREGLLSVVAGYIRRGAGHCVRDCRRRWRRALQGGVVNQMDGRPRHGGVWTEFRKLRARGETVSNHRRVSSQATFQWLRFEGAVLGAYVPLFSSTWAHQHVIR